MKILAFHHIPTACVSLTPEEVNLLFWMAEHHYDGHCKQSAACGGFIWGLRNSPNHYRLEWSEVDTLCKVLEMANLLPKPEDVRLAIEMAGSFRKLLSELSARYKEEAVNE